MIILMTLAGICFVAYAFWVIDLMIDKFSSQSFVLLASLTAIMLPASIIAQVLMWTGVIK